MASSPSLEHFRGNSCNFCSKVLRIWTICRFYCLSNRYYWLLGQTLAEDIENMSKSQAEAVRDWCNMVAMDKLRDPASGSSSNDWTITLSFRYQLPRKCSSGIVGAGGIGAHLLTSVQRYEYATTATILFAIIAIVITLEYTSGYLRKWVQ